jgi:hypothetical protein
LGGFASPHAPLRALWDGTVTFLCSVSLAASCHHLIARAEVVKRQILYHRVALVVSWMAKHFVDRPIFNVRFCLERLGYVQQKFERYLTNNIRIINDDADCLLAASDVHCCVLLVASAQKTPSLRSVAA